MLKINKKYASLEPQIFQVTFKLGILTSCCMAQQLGLSSRGGRQGSVNTSIRVLCTPKSVPSILPPSEVGHWKIEPSAPLSVKLQLLFDNTAAGSKTLWKAHVRPPSFRSTSFSLKHKPCQSTDDRMVFSSPTRELILLQKYPWRDLTIP